MSEEEVPEQRQRDPTPKERWVALAIRGIAAAASLGVAVAALIEALD